MPNVNSIFSNKKLSNNTENEVDDEILEQTVKDIIGRNALMFENIYENLSYYQMKALQIIISCGLNFILIFKEIIFNEESR